MNINNFLRNLLLFSLLLFLFSVIPIILQNLPLLTVLAIFSPIIIVFEKIFPAGLLISVLFIISYVVIFIGYYFLTKKLSKKIGPINIPIITLFSSLAVLLSVNIGIFFCSLSMLIPCHLEDYYNLDGILQLSLVPVVSYLAFLIAKINLFIKKQENIKFIQILLTLFIIIGIIFLLRWNISSIIETKKQGEEEVEKQREVERAKKIAEFNTAPHLTSKDMIFNKRGTTVDKTNWKRYDANISGYSLQYPPDYEILDHHAPRALYFHSLKRPYVYGDATRNSLENYITLNINFNFVQYKDIETAITAVFESLKPQKIKKEIETYITEQGLILYYIESGEKSNSPEQNLSISLLIEVPNQGYLIWNGHTYVEEGVEIFKQVAETIQKMP